MIIRDDMQSIIDSLGGFGNQVPVPEVEEEDEVVEMQLQSIEVEIEEREKSMVNTIKERQVLEAEVNRYPDFHTSKTRLREIGNGRNTT
jgi:hypothetical protein